MIKPESMSEVLAAMAHFVRGDNLAPLYEITATQKTISTKKLEGIVNAIWMKQKRTVMEATKIKPKKEQLE